MSGFSYPNIGSISAVYQVPFFNSRHDWQGRLLGGFSLNAIYQYNTGQPFTVSQGTTSSIGDNSYDIPGLGRRNTSPGALKLQGSVEHRGHLYQ